MPPNLFLMNPNGIVFGKNAAIDVAGSFMATTAETIDFNSGSKFSSTEPNKSLLTIDFAIGLGFGSIPGTIQVNGTGHNLELNTAEPTLRVPALSSLDVSSGETLALIGGDIILNRGVLNAPDGHIELGAVASGKVSFDIANLKDFSYETSTLKNIELFEESLADVSGSFGGSIHSFGERVFLNSGSGFFVQNQVTGEVSNLKVDAKSLEISGGSFRPVLIFEQGIIVIDSESDLVRTGFIDGEVLIPGSSVSNALEKLQLSQNEARSAVSFVPSLIYSESLQNAQGNNIEINTNELSVLDGGQVIARSFGEANAGNIDISQSNAINVQGASGTPGFAEQNFEIFSQINSITFGSGTGGNVKLNANDLTISDGGAITSITNGFGAGGDVVIDSTNINLIGSVPNVFLPSSIGATTNSEGDAGSSSY